MLTRLTCLELNLIPKGGHDFYCHCGDYCYGYRRTTVRNLRIREDTAKVLIGYTMMHLCNAVTIYSTSTTLILMDHIMIPRLVR